MIDRPVHLELSANVVAFCRLLRGQGFPIGPAEEADALRGLGMIQVADREEFYFTLRTILTGSRREQEIFDNAFACYWDGKMQRAMSKGEQEIESLKNELPLRIQENRKGGRTLLPWGTEPLAEAEEALPGYSPLEVLKRKDFRNFTEQDVVEAIRIIREIARLLGMRLSRRSLLSRTHQQFDFRRTMRRSLRNGGEVIDLAFRRRALRPVKIVLLCDVSGSMESYSRFLITFLYALQHVYGRIETFAFSTSLHRITRLLKGENLSKALKEVSASVPDWSGGTRIGKCLQTFLEEHGHTLLNKDTAVLILSDGWDIGEVDLLEECMRQIHRKANGVIWLNPLLGARDYEPSCQGMQAALPHIDLFLPAHNLESFRDLSHRLSSNPKRKQISAL